MAKIPDYCEFTLRKADQVQLRTQTNGDRIEMRMVLMSQENAAALAWLINSRTQLMVEIKSTGTPIPS